MTEIQIRPGETPDLSQLNDLYNHYVRETPVTFDMEPIGMDRRRAWFEQYGPTGRHRLFVAVEAGHLLGYATSSPLRPKQAYETSVETTIYLAPDATRRGVGSRLYTALLDALAGEDVHRAYGIITMPNAGSVALHEKFGFKLAGYFTAQGRKFDKYWDVAWYEKALGE